jgi:hypothetical protein
MRKSTKSEKLIVILKKSIQCTICEFGGYFHTTYTACNNYLTWCKDVFLAFKHLWKQELSALHVVDKWDVMMPRHIHNETIQ